MSDPAARCHLHPDREAYISCQRCSRPICPQCMREAAVGFQCPTCIRAGAKAVRQPRTIAGGRLPAPGRENVVSMTIIGLNVVMFVLTDIVRVSQVEAAGVMIAANVFDDGTVYDGMADGGYWRLVTSAFLHGGILHLALNMYALYLFGPFVERALGTWRFLVAYLTMAVFSGAVVYLLSAPHTPTVGASGAIFGLFGLALLLLVRAGQNVNGLLLLLAANAFISFTVPNISWEGHAGGLLAGLVLGAAVAYAPRSRRDVAQLAAAGFLLAATAAIVVLRTADLTG